MMEIPVIALPAAKLLSLGDRATCFYLEDDHMYMVDYKIIHFFWTMPKNISRLRITVA